MPKTYLNVFSSPVNVHIIYTHTQEINMCVCIYVYMCACVYTHCIYYYQKYSSFLKSIENGKKKPGSMAIFYMAGNLAGGQFGSLALLVFSLWLLTQWTQLKTFKSSDLPTEYHPYTLTGP